MTSSPILMLGNEALACGLLENGCRIATSYPGTPASEILSSLMEQSARLASPVFAHWSINEKVAFETAFAGCMTGLRTAVSMKQVGLNVASDPMMSAAYMGVNGGFVIISADDPGPHSSQTEQDSRLMAMMARIPVLDPDSPRQAKEMVAAAYRLSEQFIIPVMIRPTTRVCHSRQDVEPKSFLSPDRKPEFVKDPARWAATPKFRFRLHGELEEKIAALADESSTVPFKVNPGAGGSKALVASGVAAAHAREILKSLGLWDSIPLYQVLQPYPLHHGFISELIRSFEEILVLEETMPVIEMQMADRHRVRGKMDNWVPKVGELLPDKIEERICAFAGLKHTRVEVPAIPEKRPTLCAGCPHRASFFAVKKAAPKAIYTSDIGCYTLGLNMGAVDTVLCMGAAIGQAIGFYHAYKGEDKRPDIVATIGDSTFFHAGIPALVDAVVQNVKFVLLILDNRTTAMTGNQPTPAAGDGTDRRSVDIAGLVRGCGIEFCREADPYRLDELIDLLGEAVSYSREKGPAVVISRHPCLIDSRSGEHSAVSMEMEINESCDGCGYCIRHFECPALVLDEPSKKVCIDPKLCIGCGICRSICPKQSIQEKKDREVSR